MNLSNREKMKDFMTLYVRQWRGILAAMGVSFLLTGILLSLTPQRYAASAELRIFPENSSGPSGGEAAAAPVSFLGEVLAPEVLRHAVDELRLDRHWKLSVPEAAQRLLKMTRVDWWKPKSHYVVTVTSTDPDLSLQLAQALSRAVILKSVEARFLRALSEEGTAGEERILGEPELLNSLPLFAQDPALRKLHAKKVSVEALLSRTQDGERSTEEVRLAEEEQKALAVSEKAAQRRILSGFKASAPNGGSRRLFRVELVRETSDPALPLPKPGGFYFFLAGLGGLIAASAWIFLAFLLDDRIYDAGDLEHYALNYPYLGSVPLISRKTGREDPAESLAAWHRSKTPLDDCFRYLRIAINFIASPGTAKILPVSSLARGEGKTFIACHLAASLALDRNRTLLVDADFGNPALHRIFKLRHPAGISNFLADHVEVSSVIQPSGIPYLDWTALGTSARQARSLLVSERMTLFLEEVKARYDRIVIHAASLEEGGWDAARAAGHFIWVVQSGRVSSETFQRKRVPSGVKVLGVVLNRVLIPSQDISYENHLYQLKMLPPDEPA